MKMTVKISRADIKKDHALALAHKSVRGTEPSQRDSEALAELIEKIKAIKQ